MMEGNLEQAADQPIFAAELTPYRSLGRKGYRILFAVTGTVCLVHAIFFMTTGAWPIGLFFGIDFLLLYGAFWLNYRAARAREEVTVSRTSLSIRKFTPAGRMTEHNYKSTERSRPLRSGRMTPGKSTMLRTGTRNSVSPPWQSLGRGGRRMSVPSSTPMIAKASPRPSSEHWRWPGSGSDRSGHQARNGWHPAPSRGEVPMRLRISP